MYMYLWHVYTYNSCIICIYYIDMRVRYNTYPHKDILKYEISYPVTLIKCFFWPLYNKIFKLSEKLKKFCNEQPYAHHLDSIINILLYLLYHI